MTLPCLSCHHDHAAATRQDPTCPDARSSTASVPTCNSPGPHSPAAPAYSHFTGRGLSLALSSLGTQQGRTLDIPNMRRGPPATTDGRQLQLQLPQASMHYLRNTTGAQRATEPGVLSAATDTPAAHVAPGGDANQARAASVVNTRRGASEDKQDSCTRQPGQPSMHPPQSTESGKQPASQPARQPGRQAPSFLSEEVRNP
jgi:hypothetical protein